MLEINTEVERGILFIRLNGILNQNNFKTFGLKIISGMSELSRKKIGFTKDRLFYVDSNIDAFKYFCL